ncbi:MAG: 1,4-dihydroxy-2-naphthoyl-CoA hydrolase [Chlamydiota bacterium]|jgi:1,4-dihydroxy-2-naphthoyl-CoA hydrolase
MDKIWTTPVSCAILNERSSNTLTSHLGMEFTEVGPNFLVVTMPVDARTLQPDGILHGGATAALVETVASVAANYCLEPGYGPAVGLEINVNHMKAMHPGKVIATATPCHLGRSTQVWDVKVKDESGRLIAVGRMTMFVIRKTEA